MQLRCPECSTAYRVDDELITGTEPTFRCSRCRHVFVVAARSATHEEQGADGVIDTGPFGSEADDASTPEEDPGSARSEKLRSTTDRRGHEGSSDAPLRSLEDSISLDPQDDFFVFPKEETGTDTSPPRSGGQISVLPFVSLFGILLFAFALVTMTYQVDPGPLESLISKIPWYGPAVFESKHFKRGLEFESLASGLQSVLGQNEVLIISGKLVNRNTRGVQNVQIQARIYDADGKPLGKQTVYLGNALSFKIIRDMTPREISLLQSLKPQNVYRVEPNDSANFTIVLPKPKKGVGAFSCRVISAEATA